MKNLGKGKILMVLTLILILLITLTANFVFAEDGLYPNLGKTAANSGDLNFIQFRDNYYLDTEKISFFKNPLTTISDGVANFLFAAQKGTATLQIAIFQMAIKSNILELLEEFIRPFIDNMRTYIFDGFSTVFIAICGFILIVKLAANRQAQAIEGLVQVLIIVTLAFVFYNYPVELMRGVNSATEGISNEVLQGPYQLIWKERFLPWCGI